MCWLPSNIPASSSTRVTPSNGIVRADALAGIDMGKGKKRVLASFDSDDGEVGTSKKLRLVPYESDADIEMADDVSA